MSRFFDSLKLGMGGVYYAKLAEDLWVGIRQTAVNYEFKIGGKTTTDLEVPVSDSHALEQITAVLIGTTITKSEAQSPLCPTPANSLTALLNSVEPVHGVIDTVREDRAFTSRFRIKRHCITLQNRGNAIETLILRNKRSVGTRAKHLCRLLQFADCKQPGEPLPFRFDPVAQPHRDCAPGINLTTTGKPKSKQAIRLAKYLRSLCGEPCHNTWRFPPENTRLTAVIEHEANPTVRFELAWDYPEKYEEAKDLIRVLCNNGKILWPTAPCRSRRLLKKVQDRVEPRIFSLHPHPH